jgi:hypothetical protein
MKKIVFSILSLTLVFLFVVTPVFASTGYLAIDLPEKFDWSGPDINIYKNINGYYTDLDIQDYKIVVENGVDVYVDKTLGDDSTGDGTELNPYASITKALTVIDVETIFINEGWYTISEGFQNNQFTDLNVNFIGVGDVYLTAFIDNQNYTFNLVTSRDYTYQYVVYAPENIMEVYDRSQLDFYGGYLQYQEVESINAVDLTPGSFYVDDTSIYVHTFDDRVPDDDILIDKTGVVGYFTNSSVYMENIKLYGGFAPFKALESNIYLNDIEIKYSQNNGLDIDDTNIISYKVETAHNHLDGFNYANLNATTSPWMMEIDVQSYANGLTNSETNWNNASSMHQNYVGIRLNGEYSYSKGVNVHDIESAQSVNYGSVAHNSLSLIEDRDTNFRIDETTIFNLMWLYDVESYGSLNDFQPNPLESDQLIIGSYSLEDSDLTYPGAVVAPNDTSIVILGITWYWWLAGIVVFYFGFTKKGRKTLGLKK